MGSMLAPCWAVEDPVRPNIIVILADDLGYADVGFQGCKHIPTPNLDSLARQGIRFTNGYVSHPFCSPTRAGLMTGRYQQRFGHENNPAWLPEDSAVGLPLSETTLPQTLARAGYVTGAVGKWHLGAAPCFHPNERGFTEYFGFLGGGHMYLPGTKGGVEYTIPLLRNKEPVEQTEYMTDQLSAEAVSFIARHKSQPFFLYLAYNAVHTPLQAPEKYLRRFESIADSRRRTYAAMTSAMDDGVGLVLKSLQDQGIERNTMVWFLSDNGGPPPNVAPTCNDPLRGHKGTVYEGGIRVPFAVQWPARLPAGTVVHEPVISLDVLPTAAAAAGATLPSDRKLDGVNLLPFLLGQSSGPPHDVLHWRTGGGASWAIRSGNYKLVKQGEKPELFDLRGDIAETRDLLSEKPDIAANLQKLHDAWNSELVAPQWNNPKPKAKKAVERSVK
jgi:arylsulfatase A-like enzyme